MLIYFRNVENSIRAEFWADELKDGRLGTGRWDRRIYGVPQSLTYTFENFEERLILMIEFGRYKDPGVLCKLTLGQPVKEALMLWKLAHLPGVGISGHEGRLMDGRPLDLINGVLFFLDEIDFGRWTSNPTETEELRAVREACLKRMANAAPALFNDRTSGMIIPGDPSSVTCEFIYESDSRFSSEHDPKKETACAGCSRWFPKEEMTEVRPGLIICTECKWNPLVLGKLEVGGSEFFRIFRGVCDGCRIDFEKEELTHVTPGGNLCPECLSAKGWFK